MTLVVGAVVIVSAVLGHQSLEWNYSTRLYKDRMLDLGLNAAGALTIGLGVLPVVAGLASLWRAPGEPVTRELRTFRSVLLAAIIGFGLYTGGQGDVRLDHLRDVHLRAEPHLPRTAALHRHGALARTAAAASDRARSIGGLRARTSS